MQIAKLSNDSIKDTDLIIMHVIGKSKILTRLDGLKVMCQYSESDVEKNEIKQRAMDLFNLATMRKN